jgi:predicted RNA-binding Zn ribbon-like protein
MVTTEGLAEGAEGFGKRVGGRLCLDFVNTVRARVSNPDRRRGRDYFDRTLGERLASYEALLAWSVVAGALPEDRARALRREAALRPGDAERVLRRGVLLRESLYRIFKSVIEGWTPEPVDLAVLNEEAGQARQHQRLVATPHFAWVWESDPTLLERPLWPVVESAAELLTAGELERLGQCAGVECGWLFFDTSRSRRRRWCDMADCGNVAKVRRFRQKRR